MNTETKELWFIANKPDDEIAPLAGLEIMFRAKGMNHARKIARERGLINLRQDDSEDGYDPEALRDIAHMSRRHGL